MRGGRSVREGAALQKTWDSDFNTTSRANNDKFLFVLRPLSFVIRHLLFISHANDEWRITNGECRTFPFAACDVG